jgi:hypothetical protein
MLTWTWPYDDTGTLTQVWQLWHEDNQENGIRYDESGLHGIEVYIATTMNWKQSLLHYRLEKFLQKESALNQIYCNDGEVSVDD